MSKNPFEDLVPGAAPASPMNGAPPQPLPSPPMVMTPAQAASANAQQQNVDIAREGLQIRKDQLALDQANSEDATNQLTKKQKTANLDAVVNQINRVQELYNSGLRNEPYGFLSSLADLLPTPENQQFNAASAGLAEQGLAAFRVPGVGAQSDTELRQFVEANRPSSTNFDTTIEEKLLQLRSRVDATRAAMGLPPAQWNGLDNTDTPPSGVNPATAWQQDSPLQMQAATGQMRTVADQEQNKRLEAMFRSGASYAEMNAAANEFGGSISPREYAEARKFLKANPDYTGQIMNVTRQVPISAYDQAITKIGDNAAGAYAIGAGQMLSANTLDNIGGPDAQLAIDMAQAQSPDAFMVGGLTGGALAALTGEAGLARLGAGPGIGRALASDTLYGGAAGAGDAEGGRNRLAEAAIGGLSGAIGGGLGAGTVALGRRAFAPTASGMEKLYASGVRPSPGQRFANSGTAGRLLNKTEEKLQSIPVVGDFIHGTRDTARDQFQIGAFNESLKEIGLELPPKIQPGTAPHAFAQKAFNDVYDTARAGMQVIPDGQLTADLSALAPDIATLGPKAKNALKSIMANHVEKRLTNGILAGDAYKKTISDLGKYIARYGKGSTAEDTAMADILQGVRTSLDNAARRHSLPESVALLDAADAGYAKLVRIEEAAMRRGGEPGTFSPVQFDSAVQKTSGGVRSKAYLRGDALMQDYAEQGRGLGDYVPNSGTFDRAIVGGAAAGAGYVSPAAAVVLGAIGTLYAPGVRRATTAAFKPAGATRRAISEKLKRIERIAGATGAAVAVQDTTASQ